MRKIEFEVFVDDDFDFKESAKKNIIEQLGRYFKSDVEIYTYPVPQWLVDMHREEIEIPF